MCEDLDNYIYIGCCCFAGTEIIQADSLPGESIPISIYTVKISVTLYKKVTAELPPILV